MGPRKLKKRRENNNALLGLENGYEPNNTGPIWRRKRLESWPTFFSTALSVSPQSLRPLNSRRRKKKLKESFYLRTAYTPTLQTQNGTSMEAEDDHPSNKDLFFVRLSIFLKNLSMAFAKF